MPLLKREQKCSAQFNCQRNPQLWKTYNEYSAHYSRITSNEMRLRLTGVDIRPPTEQMGSMGILINYTQCSWNSKEMGLPYKTLLPRAQFANWLYALFFHLALPFGMRDADPRLMVHSPLNLSILFRLLSHLRLLNYPSHWLSDFLSSILSTSISTTVRPPPLPPSHTRSSQENTHQQETHHRPFRARNGYASPPFRTLTPF
jgi:hypothetical protein